MHHNHRLHLHHHGIHLETRSPLQRPDIVPHYRQPYLNLPEEPTLVKRDPLPGTDSAASTVTCDADAHPEKCEKPASTTNSTTLPVVLGAVIPIVCAIIVLIFLHRRNLKKLRKEDADDKHKSLDFGLDMGPSKGGRSMREAEKGYNNNHMKGMSLDIGPSPYMLPPSLRGSKDSLTSLSRSIRADDDKYRHAFGPENGPLRSHQRGPHDDVASIGASTVRGGLGDEMNYGLLGNAQRMSRSSPPLHDLHIPASPNQIHDNGFELHLPRSPSPVFIPGVPSNHEPAPAIKIDEEPNDTVGDSRSLGPLPHDQPDFPLKETPLIQPGLDSTTTQNAPLPMPRISFPSSDGASDYGDDNRISNPAVPAVNVQGAESNPGHEAVQDAHAMPTLPEEPPQTPNLRLDPRRDTRRLTMGLRPLPPEDPADNAEQRANRIRSFYKEYFDESKGAGAAGAGARETYYEDYGSDYYPQDDYAYDPMTGEYFDAVPAPYAEPVTRRAMTPPPRAPPRFQGTSRHMASGSIGGFSERLQPPGPRAFSSASGRMPGPRAPHRPAPAPTPLSILPTPHLLKDDALMSAVDFAPGKNFRDQREGRPETPLGGVRNFNPMLRAHTPLASAFDELAAIPSPHALRKSGTYDNLDFAPPPRFKNSDTASDAGSIRSNRTGISITHMNNIRTGAYRVSRLPPETVGTKDDLMSNLRPTWDLR